MCYFIAIYDNITIFSPIVMYVVGTPNHEYLSLYLSDFLIGPISATPIWKSCFWRINTLPASCYQLQRHFRASSHFKNHSFNWWLPFDSDTKKRQFSRYQTNINEGWEPHANRSKASQQASEPASHRFWEKSNS